MNAYDCGKKAFENKLPRVPAFDDDFVRYVSALQEFKIEAFKAWLIGWDSANIKALMDFPNNEIKAVLGSATPSEFMEAHFSDEYEHDRLGFCGHDDGY